MSSLIHDLVATTAPSPLSLAYVEIPGALDRKLTLDNLFATMMGWHNAKNFGIVGDGVADDTGAIQAAFQTIVTAGGGTIFFPAGTYLLSTAQGGTGVAQVEFPVVGDGAGISTTQQVTLRILGALPPPTSGELTALPVDGYTIFKSTMTTGTHTSVFRSPGTGRNNLHVDWRDSIFQCPANPNYHALDCRYQQDTIFRHLLAHAGGMAYSTVTQPTHSAAAFLFPQQHKAVGVSAQNMMVWGYPIGYYLGELLTDGINLTASACLEAIEQPDNTHPNWLHSFTALECARVIKSVASGSAGLHIGQLDIENANGQFAGWMDKINHIDDGGQLYGTLNYHVVNANSSETDTFTKSGGANLICSNQRGFVMPVAVSALPTTPKAGMVIPVTDSNTVTWGATIAGGGANPVLAVYNGTNWTVAGK